MRGQFPPYVIAIREVLDAEGCGVMRGFQFLEDALGDASLAAAVAGEPEPGEPRDVTAADFPPGRAPGGQSFDSAALILLAFIAWCIFSGGSSRKHRNPFDESEMFDPSVDLPEA